MNHLLTKAPPTDWPAEGSHWDEDVTPRAIDCGLTCLGYCRYACGGCWTDSCVGHCSSFCGRISW